MTQLGDAVLDLTVDLAAYDRDLDAAKRKTLIAAAEMDRMLDLKLDVDTSPLARAMADMERRFTGPTVRVGGVVGRMERQLDGSIGQMRLMAAEATRLMEHRAATVRMLADAEAAAAKKTTAAYVEQAAAARAVDMAAETSRQTATRRSVLYSRPTEPSGGSRVYGVRGTNAPGSEGDPMTVVIEAANRVGMGSLAAAVGYDSAGASQTATTGGTRSAAAMSERDLIRVVGEGERGAQMRLAREMAKATAARVAPRGESAAGEIERILAAAGAEKPEPPAAPRLPPKESPGVQGLYDLLLASETRSPIFAAEKRVAEISRGSLLQSLHDGLATHATASSEGRGHEVEDLLLAGRGGGGSGGGGLVGLLGAAGAGGRGGSGGGGPGFLSGLLWGKGGGGGGFGRYGLGLLTGGGMLAGAGTLGSFAGFGAEHVLLTAGGILGSATAALGGGGLLAGGALGKLAVGAGSDAAVMSSTIADTKELYAGYTKLEEAVARYGKGSKQAKEAEEELHQTMKITLGGTKGVAAELKVAEAVFKLNKEWDRQTSGARVQGSKILMQGVGLGEVYIPKVANAAEQNLRIINQGLKPLFAWLEGPEGMGIFDQLETEFRSQLPESLKALDQGVQLFAKTIVAAAPYTGAFTEKLDAFLTKWNRPTFFAKWAGEMGRLIGDFHVWDAFVKMLGKDLFDLFSQDAKTGEGIIVTLTGMLEKLHEWETSTSGKNALSNIFTVHKEEIIALLGLLPQLVKVFEPIYMTVAPPLVKAATAIATAVGFMLEKFEALGKGAEWMVGLTLLAAKLGKLSLIVRGLAGAFGLASAKTTLMKDATIEENAAATAAALSNTELAGSMGTSAAMLRIPLVDLRSPAANAAMEGSRLPTDLRSGLLRAGVYGAGGALAGSALASILGAKGTLSTAMTTGGAGLGLGAGIGTMIAPGIGTAIGAGIGLGVGTATPYVIKFLGDVFSKEAPAYGRKLAHGVMGPLSDVFKASERLAIEQHLASSLDTVRETTPHKVGLNVRVGNTYYPGSEFAKLTSAHKAAIRKAATETAELFEKEFSVVQTKTPNGLLAGFLHATAGEPTAVREVAAENVLKYAQGLESQGELVKGAWHTILGGMEKAMPGFTRNIVGATGTAGRALSQMEIALRRNVEESKAQFYTTSSAYKKTGNALIEAASHTENELLHMAQHAGPREREIILGDAKRLRQSLADLEQKQVEDVRTHHEAINTLNRVLASKSKGTLTAVVGYAGEASHAVSETSVDAARAFAQELESIESSVEHALAKLGAPSSLAKGIAHTLATGEAAKRAAEAPAKTLVPVHKATGGLVSIGTPGEAGHDSVPLNVGGTPIVVAPGEQVAVFNRHQLPVVNEALSEYGGLSGLFNTITTPNYLAAGGIAEPKVRGAGALPSLVRAGVHDVARAADAMLRKKSAARQVGGVSTTGLSGSLIHVVRQIAARMGWSNEVQDWLNVINVESGGSMTAQNPTSSAYGIAQFIEGPGAYAKYGGNVGTMAGQLVAMANYIAGRYGNPAGAWAHELADKWYAQGGLVGYAGGTHDVKHPKSTHKPARRRAGRVPRIAHTNLYRQIPSLRQMPFAVQQHASLLNHLLGGQVPALQEAFSLTESHDLMLMSGLPGGGEFLAEVLNPTTGKHETVVQQGNVDARVGQLEGLSGMEHTILADMEHALRLVKPLERSLDHQAALRLRDAHKLRARIKTLQAQLHEAIERIRRKIREHLARMRAIEKEIQQLREQKIPPVPHGLHGAARVAAENRHTEATENRSGAITKLEGERRELEMLNRRLGGSETTIGTGGQIGHVTQRYGGQIKVLENNISKLDKQHETLRAHAKTVHEDHVGLIGVSGMAGMLTGGSIGEARSTLGSLAHELSELGAPLAAKAAEANAATGAGVEAPESELASLLKQQNEQLAEQLRVSQAQYGVLSTLPPFGGSFAKGGIVPGLSGEPRLVVAHGGESIAPVGAATDIHLHFKPGTEWLRDFVDVRVEKNNRTMARRVSRPLPSAGGGR